MAAAEVPYDLFIALLTNHGRIRYASRGFVREFGFSQEEIVGQRIGRFLRDTMLCGANLETGVDFDRCFVFTKNREPREVYITRQNDESTKYTEYIFRPVPGSGLDSKFICIKRMLDDDRVGVAIWSAVDFQLLDCNERYAACFPCKTRESIRGCRLNGLVGDSAGSGGTAIWTEARLRNKAVYQRELKGLYTGRDDRCFDNSLIPIEEGGAVKYIVSILEDVTERVRDRDLLLAQKEMLLQQERALHASEKKLRESLQASLDMKDRFISFISHEFKTPLAVIQLALQTMDMTCSRDITAKMRGYLNNIRLNTFRQMRLVENLLDIARSNANAAKLNRRNVDVSKLAASIVNSVRIYAESKNIELVFQGEPDIVICTDGEKFERILLNLLSNAIKFTPEGRAIRAGVFRAGDTVCLEVEDQGIGIPEDKLEVIFDLFGQVDSSLARQAEGTGIGLYLVRQLVTLLGGSVSARSEVGKGTAFTVALPAFVSEEPDEAEGIANLVPQESRIEQAVSIEFSSFEP